MNGLARPPHCEQDEGVREDDDGTGNNIAKDKETDDVRHGKGIMVWSVPWNTECGKNMIAKSVCVYFTYQC